WSAQQRKIETNPHLLELGTQTREVLAGVIGGSMKTRMGIVPTDAAVARMDDARWTAYELFKSDPLWGLIEPNITRILTIMWKAAGLFALSNGRHVIEVEDVLFAIREGETWLANSVRLMRGISSNDFTKAVDTVGKHLEEKGSVPKSSLYRWAFNGLGLSQRELDEITQNLLAQGLIREKGVSWVWADGNRDCWTCSAALGVQVLDTNAPASRLLVLISVNNGTIHSNSSDPMRGRLTVIFCHHLMPYMPHHRARHTRYLRNAMETLMTGRVG
ncbi:MAG: hypothetical protein WAZ12_02035, partial [Candidatus Absconditicoccaceae bacterium]